MRKRMYGLSLNRSECECVVGVCFRHRCLKPQTMIEKIGFEKDLLGIVTNFYLWKPIRIFVILREDVKL